LSTDQPPITLPSVLATAIGNPSAALVATALCIGMLHPVMNGTEMKPPPAPTSPETAPMTPPATRRPPVPGIWRDASVFLLRSICVAENATKMANSRARAAPLTSG